MSAYSVITMTCRITQGKKIRPYRGPWKSEETSNRFYYSGSINSLYNRCSLQILDFEVADDSTYLNNSVKIIKNTIILTPLVQGTYTKDFKYRLL